MARTVKDAKLDSRTARLKLPQRREPYWRALSEGIAIGYRKGSKGGSWIARHYSATHGRKYFALGTSDDVIDADGVNILNFDQAQGAARGWLAGMAKGESGEVVPAGPYTVANAMTDYLGWLQADGRTPEAVKDTTMRAKAHILPALGSIEVAALTADRLRQWRDKLAKTPARVRTPRGVPQRHLATVNGRARKVSANRMASTLTSALNHAFREGKVRSDSEWRRVKPIKGVSVARPRYLSIAEAKRLLNACDPDFRRLVRGALETGCRYGELCRLVIADFKPDIGAVEVKQSKSGKGRHVILSDEGATFFAELTAGRPGNAPMFGRVWARCNQDQPMKDAVARAKIVPPITFHGARHTWASHAVMNGVPLLVVARNLGHTDTRMVEHHYGHMAPSFVADEIRRGAPRFGATKARKVVAIRPV